MDLHMKNLIMYEASLKGSKFIFALFLICCIMLTLVYNDFDFLKCNAVTTQRTEDIIDEEEVQENTTSSNHNNSTKFHNRALTIINSTPSQTKVSPTYKQTLATTQTTKSLDKSKELKFLVQSEKCKIVDLDPFNWEARKYFHPEKYKSCRKHELLTYVTKKDNIATLHINNEAVPSYSSKGVTCCYSNVTRKRNPFNPDGSISISSCQKFENNVAIHHHPVIVKCTEQGSHTQVYENAHMAVTITDDVQRKVDGFDNNTKPLSILLIGIDSISRLNFIRTMPRTYRFLKDNDWLTLDGYNKMDDNTFPNLMAILTGFNNTLSYKICDPFVVGKLDACPMLWYDYRKLGYITGYGEDEASLNTFNYRKKGFRIPPTDYYFRPYIVATEKLTKVTKDSMTYCTGPETAGERIMNLARDFANTFKNYSNFGFFWMNSFSHNRVNTPTGMDDKVRHFLEDITDAGVTDNSIVIFLSDHGMRFGDIRLTNTGWLEERLPFIYFSFPKWFQDRFPNEMANFKNNTNKLTSPYDLHMTLKHILTLQNKNLTVTSSVSCPTCMSLFDEIPYNRSCSEAGISSHWCTCLGFTKISLEKSLERAIVSFILNEIHSIIKETKSSRLCAKFTLDRLLRINISQKFSYQSESYLLVQIQTKPKAIFETTIGFTGDISSQNFTLSGSISRLDSYNDHSKCVSDGNLRKYCYCH